LLQQQLHPVNGRVVQPRTSPFGAIEPCNVVTSYTYDRAGNRTSITDANSHTHSAVFDAADRQIIIRDALTQETQWDYDLGSRITLQRDPRGSDFDLSYSYDELDRPTELSAIALTAPITTTYDTLGRRTHLGDATGVTAFVYDALNRVTGVTAPATGSVGYGYDARGLRTHLTYPDSSAIDYTYYNDGQLAGVWQSATQLVTTTYTLIGQPDQTSRANGITTSFGYDAASRLRYQHNTLPSGTVSEYVYTTDRRGLRTAADETWTARDSADAGTGTGLFGEYYSDTSFGTLVLTRTDSLIDFDWGLGSPDVLIPDEEFSVRWTGTVQPRYTEAYTFTTTADDGIRLWVNGDLLIDDWNPHPPEEHSGQTAVALTAGQQYTITLEYFEDSLTAEVQLEWQSARQGREVIPTSQLYPPGVSAPEPLVTTGLGRTLTYGYDGLQRLTDVTEAGPVATTAYSYTYDLAGNRLDAWTDGVVIQNRSYDDANQVIGWAYDAAGNLLDDGTTNTTWDALNRLTVQGTTTNTYNGDGVLVAQTTGSGTISYTQDLASPLSQILSDGTSQYIYGSERLYGVAGGTRTWYLGDALGSVRQTVDDTGLVQQTQRYDAWGAPQGSQIAPFGYTSELQQGNQVYLRARWYQAGSGTFGSRDPFQGKMTAPQSLHRYAYTQSNPVNFADPTGWYRCLTGPSEYTQFCATARIALDTLTNAFQGPGNPQSIEALLLMFSNSGDASELPGGSGIQSLKLRQSDLTPAQERLEFVLWATHTRQADGTIDESRTVHFGIRYGDGGFASQFRDRDVHPDSSNQVGHFLTAAHIGYDSSKIGISLPLVTVIGGMPQVHQIQIGGYQAGLACLVGHELMADGSGDIDQCAAALLPAYYRPDLNESGYMSALDLYRLAKVYDRAGNTLMRDCTLYSIVRLPEKRSGSSHDNRSGNSIQDLRLSLKGDNFGQAIKYGSIRGLSDADQWLSATLRDGRRVLTLP